MVGEGCVGWVAEKKVAVVQSSIEVVGTAGVGISLRKIDSDKVPARAEGSWGAVGDEEKSVTRAQEGTVESIARRQRSWWERIGATDGRGRAGIRKICRGRWRR
jgi:hypothetical protein